MSACSLLSWVSHHRYGVGILVVLFLVAATFLTRLPQVFLVDEAGYAGSFFCPPWVCRYCPQIVDGLISRRDVLKLLVLFCFGFLLTEALIGGSAGFFAEGVADHTSWLIEFCTVGSSRGTGKAYLCVACLHRVVVGKVNSVRHEVGGGKCPYNNWSIIVQSTGEGLWGSDNVVIWVRGLSRVREVLEHRLKVRGGEGSSKGVFMR